jgi:Domain of Unknown Function (DUF1080)
MESSSPESELDALERTLLASIPLIRRARRNCLVVRNRARPQPAKAASSTARATEMTKQTDDVVQPHRFRVGEFVAFTEERLPGLVWAGEWEVVGLLTGGHGEPQYRIRSPDQVRINVVAERDLPSGATAAALTDIVFSRRIRGDIVASPPVGGTPGFEELFDGTSLGDWTMSTIRNQPGRDNSGSFLARAGILEARPGTDIGLLWLTRPMPPRYVLRLQWMRTAPDDNSGVYLGFPDPTKEGYDNTAYVAVNFGFEVQIDELARPDNAAVHRTGAVYGFKAPTDGPLVVAPVGEWNDYEITVDGPDLTVALNGQVVNRFHFTGDAQSPRRGLPSTAEEPRFIGLQTHTGRVLFRRIQGKAL